MKGTSDSLSVTVKLVIVTPSTAWLVLYILELLEKEALGASLATTLISTVSVVVVPKPFVNVIVEEIVSPL